MPDIDPNEFTDREKYILSYYRDQELSSVRRHVNHTFMFIAASIVCVVAGIVREDQALSFVGYALVVARLWFIVAEGGKTTKDFQSIFRKYEAKVKALSQKGESK